MATNIKVTSTKTVKDYQLPTPKLYAIQTWWYIKNNNKNIPITQNGYLKATIKHETQKALLLTTTNTHGTTAEHWIPKSIILYTKEA
jgi:hypothetical protein